LIDVVEAAIDLPEALIEVRDEVRIHAGTLRRRRRRRQVYRFLAGG